MADEEQVASAEQQLKRPRPRNAAEGAVPQAHARAHNSSAAESITQPESSSTASAGPSLPAAVELLSSGVSSLQSTLATVLHAAQHEREQLEQARQQLEDEKAAFEEERQRVQQVFADSDQIVLNVGGHR